MLKLVYIAVHDLRVTFRERAILINLVIIPIALIFAVGVAQGGLSGPASAPVQRVDVLDQDESASSAQFITALRAANPGLTLCPMDGPDACASSAEAVLDDARLSARLEEGITRAGLVIPRGFGTAILRGEPARLVYRSQEDPLQPSLVRQAVDAAIVRLGGAAIAAQVGLDVADSFDLSGNEDERQALGQTIYDRASQTWQEMPQVVRYIVGDEAEQASGVPGGGGFRQSVPGMGTMYVMFTVLAGASLLVTERRNWTLQRLVTMPVARWQIIGGKMLARFAMGMVQYAVAFTAGLALGVSFGSDFLALILLMSAFTFSIAGLAFLLATLVQTDQQAGTAVTFLALTLAPLGGAWWPLEIVPDFMRTIAMLSPVGWAMDGFTQLIFYRGTMLAILPNVGVLLAMGALLFFLAVRRFRYQ